MRHRLGILLYLWIVSALPLAAQSGSPVLQSVAPNLIVAGSQSTAITLSGSGFNPSSEVRLYLGLGSTPLQITQLLLVQPTFIDSGTLQTTIPHDWLTFAGTIGVRVFNKDTSTESLTSILTVFPSVPPVVSSVNVAGAGRGTTYKISFTGTNLTTARLLFGGSGISVGSSSGNDASFVADISVAADAPIGAQAMTISTLAGSTSTCGQTPCSFAVLGDAGTWTPTGPFHDFRSRAVVVRLLDGRVLLAGGGTNNQTQATASAEILDPSTGQWTPTSSMTVARTNAGGTLLPDGRVLVAGGSDGKAALSSVEIYDPVSQTWTTSGSMTSNYPPTPILLTDGRVLLLHQGTLLERSAEIFDAVRGTFQPIARAGLNFQRPVASLLRSGKVLIAEGGVGSTIYDAGTNSYNAATTSCGNIFGPTARLLPDGRVLCRNTYCFRFCEVSVSKYASLYDPQTDSTKKSAATASGPDVLLPGGLVFIAGDIGDILTGFTFPRGPNTLYDPSSDQIVLVPVSAIVGNPDTMILLEEGRALALGPNAADIFGFPAPDNPVPSIGTVSASSPASAADFISLDVRGGVFLSNSFVQIGSTKLVTLYLGSHRVVAFVPPALRSTLSSGVSVVNPSPGGGASDRVQVGFAAPAPVISSITPNTAAQGSQFDAVISGQNLGNAVSVSFASAGVIATIRSGGDATTLPISVNVALTAGLGPQSLTLETGSGSTTVANALQVQRGFPATKPLPIEDVELVQVRSGYAVITPGASTAPPRASLTYGVVRHGLVEAQAAIPPDPPLMEAILPLDIVPSIGRNVGVAVTNFSGVSASIVMTIRDEAGTTVGSPASLTVTFTQQFAKFVTELFPPAVFGAAFRGTLNIRSSAPVSMVGLRFSGVEFSTIPLSSIASSPSSTGEIVFPQFAMGSGWATTLVLTNPSDSTISGRINIFDPNGRPMYITLNGLSSSTGTFLYSIPPHGRFMLGPLDSNGQSPF